MIRFLAAVGAGLIVLAILGSIGVGHFVLHYGPDRYECVKGETL